MRIIISVLFMILLSAIPVPAQEAGKISFRDLAPGEEITVRFESQGDYHREEYEFTFIRGTQYSVGVERIESRRNRKTCVMEIIDRTPLGRLTLSEADIAGLDSLLSFYRLRTEGFCTSRDLIQFTHRSADGRESEERYLDATCNSYEKREGITSLRELVERFGVAER